MSTLEFVREWVTAERCSKVCAHMGHLNPLLKLPTDRAPLKRPAEDSALPTEGRQRIGFERALVAALVACW